MARWPVLKLASKPDPRKIARMLELAPKRFGDWRVLWAQLAPIISEGLTSALQSGTGFAPLAPSTIKTKSRLGIPLRRFYSTGRTLAQMANPTKGKDGAIRMMTNKRLVMGVSERYQFAQIAGTTSAGRKHMTKIPSSGFIRLTADLKQHAEALAKAQAKAFVQDIANELARLGRG